MLLRILGVLLLIAVVVIGFVVWSLRDLGADELETRYAAQDRFIEADGLRWRVRESGPTDAPALVLIHGFGYSLESWAGWAEILDDGFRVVRMDLPGHALTGPDPQDRYTNAQTTELFAGLMDALGLERFSLGGNSLGGLIAWRYAASHPDRVERLILVDAGGFPNQGVSDDPVEVPAAMKLYLTTAPEAGVQAANAALYGDPDKLSPERLTVIRDMMRREGVGKALVDRVSVFTLPDPKPLLAQIQAPTLVMWGGKDAFIPVTHADLFVDALSDVQLALYPELGHVPQEEAPERTAQDARAFLTASPS
ncbi:MAG: alpha/beta fold hydrolase [Maricaulaceae bacterium]